MKRSILIAAMLACSFTLTQAAPSTEAVQSKSNGLHICDAATDRIGLYGKTPVAQQAATVSPQSALVNIGVIASGADFSIQHKTVALSKDNIIAMYGAPVALVASPGLGKSIVVAKLTFTITRSSTAFTGGGAVIVQYAATTHGAGTQSLDSTLASTVVTGSSGTSISVRNGAVISDAASTVTQAVGLYISNDTAAFAAGTGTASVEIWYYVITGAVSGSGIQ